MSRKPSSTDFDQETYYKKLAMNYIIKGETGLLDYPYSKKIHKYWRFKTPDLALASSKKLYKLFIKNIDSSLPLCKKFIQADICIKFLKMGYSTNMQYYYHESGEKIRKYS